ncbi:probable 3-beta-hydroxysteroid-delta(8),delta(7) -isomerase, partial [Tanacetum coccineum]
LLSQESPDSAGPGLLRASDKRSESASFSESFNYPSSFGSCRGSSSISSSSGSFDKDYSGAELVHILAGQLITVPAMTGCNLLMLSLSVDDACLMVGSFMRPLFKIALLMIPSPKRALPLFALSFAYTCMMYMCDPVAPLTKGDLWMAGVPVSESVHPFSPKNLILPDYVPMVLSESTILGVYGGISLLVISFVWILAGLTHLILESYFLFTPEFFKQKTPTYLAEVWKEYSKGDSRYIGRDSTVVAIEVITILLEGPACLLAAYAIATRKVYRHLLQIAVSLGQLYGTALYFITSYLDGDNFSASPYYYYSYYIFANSFWVWIPSLIVIRSWKKLCAAARIQDQAKTKTR